MRLEFKLESINKNSRIIFLALIVVLSISFAYYGGFMELLARWSEQEQYSYGYFIPFITIYFIYQNKGKILSEKSRPEWAGVYVVIFALILLLVGELSALYIFIHYSFIFLIIGFTLSIAGKAVLKHLFIPILILCFAIPLPEFIDSALTWKLQLLSSQIGVMLIRLFNIPVFLEGNVIDLGNYKLQVVEACSGLNYLFPLMSLGFIAAYLYQAPFWQRIVVFLSTIPVTILMNSFRIGIIGILVTYSGIQSAEGFLHYFEGWAIFMACIFLLGLEILLLTKLRRDKPRFSDVFFNLESGGRILEKNLEISLSSPFVTSSVLAIVTTMGIALVNDRNEIYPDRHYFSSMPLESGEWKAYQSSLVPDIVKSLKLDDYYIADYRKDDGIPVNLYIAYYQSQRKGASPHSPRVCIPGGGWNIKELKTETIKLNDKEDLSVNRIIIQKNDTRQLVYYWFQQRGRKIVNEYIMKWYLLQDSILMNRTDGALVRFTTFIPPHSSFEEADKRIQELIKVVYPVLDDYIPQ